MENFSYPAYLLPLAAFSLAEVVDGVREKSTREGVQKRETWTGENRPAWVVPVEVVRGVREKQLPNGETREVIDTETVNVTVFAHVKPDLQPGDFAKFDGLAVGAFEGKIYVQALGASKLVSDQSGFTLEGM